MTEAFYRSLLTASLLIIAPAANAICNFDYTAGVLQYGAASGGIATPISSPETCGTSPVSNTESAGPVGNTEWEGTGYGSFGGASSTYIYEDGTGFWGYGVASMGGFFIPDLIITGGPATTVTGNLNVELGATATGVVPPTQDLAWSVRAVDSAGATLAFWSTATNVTPNAPDVIAASGALANLPVGTAFGLDVRAQWQAEKPPNNGDITYATTYLRLHGPDVMSLPAGYRVDSASAGIDDGEFFPIAATVDIERAVLHPHHDGSLGPQGIAALPDDVIPVVVFGASTLVGDPEDLNTDDINTAMLEFGPGAGGISPSHPPEFNLDVDSDGLDDARFRFRMSDAAIGCSDSSGSLMGSLINGQTFEGTDSFTADCGAVCHN